MTRRGRRTLSDEERKLWHLVKGSARPLRPDETPAADEPIEAIPAVKTAAAPAPVPKPPVAKPPPAIPGAIDRRTRTRLSRGSLDVDARLDLHGLTQHLAHQRLRRFLDEAQRNGARLVLVITGKGKPEPDGEERGVLRRAVPAWLEAPELRHLVAGYDEAGRRHGGGGALYIRLRRKRSP